MRTEIGKIAGVEFGIGGYQDAMIGFTFVLGGIAWGVQDFLGTWAMKRSEHCKWTEEEREKILADAVMRVKDLLTDAKKANLSDLVGVPIEATFEGNLLRSWRILKEVL